MYLPEGKIWYIKPQMSFETGMNFEKKNPLNGLKY